MSGNEAFGYRIDRTDTGKADQGDCETCRYYMSEFETCMLYLADTHSYDSCSEWKT